MLLYAPDFGYSIVSESITPPSPTSPDFSAYPHPIPLLQTHNSPSAAAESLPVMLQNAICLRNIGHEVCGVLHVIVSIGGKSHQIRAAALALYHVADGLFVESWLSEHANDQSTVFNQGNGSVFEFAGCISFGMDVADFFHLETAFQANGIIDAAADEEYIFRVCLLCRKPLDPLLVLQNLADLIQDDLEFFDICRVLLVCNFATNLCKLNCQRVSCNKLGAVGFVVATEISGPARV